MAKSDNPEPLRVIVAPARFAGRIAQGFAAANPVGSGAGPNPCCLDNVYEGLAGVLELARQGPVVLTVMVDRLPRKHMHLFGVLAAVDHIHTQAVSLAGRQVKLAQAAQAGADELFCLTQDRLTPWGVHQPPSPTETPPAQQPGPITPETRQEPAAPPNEPSLIELASDAVRQARQKADNGEPRQSQARPAVTATPNDLDAEPLLSDEELNALLR